MAFDIDRMKADGVSPHLIELAELSERNDTAAFERIAMGLENTEIFRQFISMESGAPVWDYMYAAGLCTKAEADWFKSEENPYKPQSGEVWYTGTLGECQYGFASAVLTETNKADTAALSSNPEAYSVLFNGVELILLASSVENGFMFTDTGEEDYNTIAVFKSDDNVVTSVKCPTDITTVEVTVAHK